MTLRSQQMMHCSLSPPAPAPLSPVSASAEVAALVWVCVRWWIRRCTSSRKDLPHSSHRNGCDRSSRGGGPDDGGRTGGADVGRLAVPLDEGIALGALLLASWW